MNKEQLVGLAVRLFAVFLVIYTLRYTTSVVALMTSGSLDLVSAVLIVLYGLVPLLVAFLLWRFPVVIASKLIPKFPETKHSKNWDEGEIEIVAFATLGLWILCSAIPNAAYWAILVDRLKSLSYGRTDLRPEHVAGIVATVVQILLGLWVLLGSKGIVRFVRKLRKVGNEPSL